MTPGREARAKSLRRPMSQETDRDPERLASDDPPRDGPIQKGQKGGGRKGGEEGDTARAESALAQRERHSTPHPERREAPFSLDGETGGPDRAERRSRYLRRTDQSESLSRPTEVSSRVRLSSTSEQRRYLRKAPERQPP